MKRLILTLFFLVTFMESIDLNSANSFKYPDRILFIGNSYTHGYNMPHILSELIYASGDKAIIESVAISSFYLKNHSENKQTINKIKQGNWDVVILQEQSELPSLTDQIVSKESYPYLRSLDKLIKTYNKCAEVFLYMTWGRKNGNKLKCKDFPEVCSYSGMFRNLKKRYLEYATNINARVVPVGDVWDYINTNYKHINLYEPDESHPNNIGAFVTAMTFYSVLFNKNPYSIVNHIKYSEEVNNIVREAIEERYFKQYDIYNFQKPSILTIIKDKNIIQPIQDKKYYTPKIIEINNVYYSENTNIYLNDGLIYGLTLKRLNCYKYFDLQKSYKYTDYGILIDDLITVKFEKKMNKLYLSFDKSLQFVDLNLYINNNLTKIEDIDTKKTYELDLSLYPEVFNIDILSEDKVIEHLEFQNH